MDEAKAREEVLVIPEERFHSAGGFQGFRPYSAEFLKAILDQQHLSFRPRGEVEIIAAPSLLAIVNHFKGTQLLPPPQPPESRSPAPYEQIADAQRSP